MLRRKHEHNKTTLYDAFLDVLFPSFCVCCNTHGDWLCSPCINEIQNERIAECIVCGERSLHGNTCLECKRISQLDGLIAAGSYRHKTFREAVHALKFNGVTSLAEPLADLLSKHISTTISRELERPTIIPIPLHKRRERQRGFNQAALIAEYVARHLSLPYADMLIRTSATAPQSSILASDRTARKQNLECAFVVGENTTLPSQVLLVDDVATTGSSLEAAAQVLYDHGVSSIWGAVVCKG